MDESLGVGVHSDEIDPLDPGLYHAIDGVRAATPNAYDLYLSEILRWDIFVTSMTMHRHRPVRVAADRWKHLLTPP